MKLSIKTVRKKNKKAVDDFADKEWEIFNRDHGFKWDSKKHIFAAYNGKNLVGFVKFKINGGTAYISQLLISKKARRNGIGKMLMAKLETYAKRRKCHVAYLETSEVHKEALQFYKNLGYKSVAKLNDNKFNIDWYFLQKRLNKSENYAKQDGHSTSSYNARWEHYNGRS